MTVSPHPDVPILTSAETRAEEASAFEQGVANERVVLENAGRALAVAVAKHYPAGRVVGVVGRGNNGRDTLVALRTLQSWGREVVAMPAGEASDHGDVLHGWPLSWESSPEVFRGAGVILDGILGTGATGPARSEMHGLIRAINEASASVVAVDGPSGVDLTTGLAGDIAVHADLTVTFGALKRGLILHPGRALAGRILVAEIGLPPRSTAAASVPRAITDGWAFQNLPFIPPDAHKTRVGIVVVVAGRAGMGGASIMAAMGALRAGAGGVRIISAAENRTAVHSSIPEAVFFDRADPDAITALDGASALVIGPGIGTDEGGAALLARVLSRFSGPAVIDADGLSLLSRSDVQTPDLRGRPAILTPHPGELARLLDISTTNVLADRFKAASEASERFGCTVLAKGAPSIVVESGTAPLVALTGHSGVATGGMGDTLAGIVGAFAAAGASPRYAAALGIHFAGRAAEAAGRGRGLLPRDVAESLPRVLTPPQPAPFEPPFLLDLPHAV